MVWEPGCKRIAFSGDQDWCQLQGRVHVQTYIVTVARFVVCLPYNYLFPVQAGGPPDPCSKLARVREVKTKLSNSYRLVYTITVQ